MNHRLAVCLPMLTILFVRDADAAAPDQLTPAGIEHFETEIRPLLAKHCFECHGPKKQESNLRLDSKEGMLKGGYEGAVLVPGRPAESLLIKAVHYDGDYQMPPTGKLDDQSIALLADWVKTGAHWPAAKESQTVTPQELAKTHWAFQPVVPPRVPPSDSDWIQTPIDNFILNGLQTKNLTPSPKADRRTLIRRAYFDLVGLPPTIEQVRRFENDPDPEAFAKVVEELLASPHYGERWGRYWLDVARYADTKGYVFTAERRYPYSYTYRDYVIEAFNQDLPYDRFLKEQIAADRMVANGEAEQSALAAMGFLTLGRRFRNNIHEITDDRIDVISRGLLGLTVTCARCHDHKFDPIPSTDYYSLYGILASSNEPDELPELPSSAPEPVRQEFEQKRDEAQKAIDDDLQAKRKEYEESLDRDLGKYLAAAHQVGFDLNRDKVDAAARKVGLRPKLLLAINFRWRELLKATQTRKDSVVEVWRAYSQIPDDKFAEQAESVRQSLLSRKEFSALGLEATLLSGAPKSKADLIDRLAAVLKKDAQGLSESLADQTQLIRQRLTQVPLDQVTRLFNRKERDHHRRLTAALERLKATHPGANPRAMVMVDREKPIEPYVFLRGNPGRRGPKVDRRFVSILAGEDPKPYTQGSGRWELAQDVASENNPLTARVFVNRVWMHHFETGFVITPSDFGVRTDEPVHRELLDYLAWTFMENGWSLKNLHRLIMLSSVYQQQSLFRADCHQADPDNALWWKYNRRRLDYEAGRDALLAAAGRLDREIGGRSFDVTRKPFSTRRSVYAFVDRQNLEGVLRTFDFASPNSSSPRRFETTVPQQSLFLMNSEFVTEQAQHLAGNLKGVSDASQRIDVLYQTLFCRSPVAWERELGVDFVTSYRPHASDWKYCFGKVAADAQSLTDVKPLPHWTGDSWSFGSHYPHPTAGYLRLTRTGGHPGSTAAYSPVLQWTAPADGVVSLDGLLQHRRKEGDGVRATVFHNGTKLPTQWVSHNQKVTTSMDSLAVKQGDRLELVVDLRANGSFDSYEWSPSIVLDSAAGKQTYSPRRDFAPKPGPWEQYAQALLMSNEFYFVD